MVSPQPPAARRISRPRWLDIRVIGGIVLLIISVAVGAKVIGSASRTSPVWAVTADLAAGTVLTAGDIAAAEVNLGPQGSVYVDIASDLVGAVLNRAVRSGELLPASALDPAGDGRVLSVSVSPDHLAPGIAHGSVIDLYLITGRSAVLGDEVSTDLLQGGVTVQQVTAPASGGLSGAVSNRYQVALLLPFAEADVLVRRLPLGEPLLVLRTSAGG